MSIYGVGTDLVSVARVAASLARGGAALKLRLFTEAECAWCHATPRPDEGFAARFAAKEAVMKALRHGFGQGVEYRDIEVIRSADGAPSIQLHGKAADLAARLLVQRIHVSLSHTEDHATAVAIAESD